MPARNHGTSPNTRVRIDSTGVMLWHRRGVGRPAELHQRGIGWQKEGSRTTGSGLQCHCTVNVARHAGLQSQSAPNTDLECSHGVNPPGPTEIPAKLAKAVPAFNDTLQPLRLSHQEQDQELGFQDQVRSDSMAEAYDCSAVCILPFPMTV